MSGDIGCVSNWKITAVLNYYGPSSHSGHLSPLGHRVAFSQVLLVKYGLKLCHSCWFFFAFATFHTWSSMFKMKWVVLSSSCLLPYSFSCREVCRGHVAFLSASNSLHFCTCWADCSASPPADWGGYCYYKYNYKLEGFLTYAGSARWLCPVSEDYYVLHTAQLMVVVSLPTAVGDCAIHAGFSPWALSAKDLMNNDEITGTGISIFSFYRMCVMTKKTNFFSKDQGNNRCNQLKENCA